MKIFFWAASMTDGTWWYRLHLVAEALKARGHEVMVSTQIGEWARDEAQIIVGQRVCNPRTSILWQELCKAGHWRMVYEIDDNLLAIDPRTNDLAAHGARQRQAFDLAGAIGHHAAAAGLPLARAEVRPGHEFRDFRDPRVQQAMRANLTHADLVTVTVPPLAEALKPYNSNVTVLPNSVPARLLDVPPQRAPVAGRVMLGWQGSATHTRDWQVAAPAVLDVLSEYPTTHMRFLGTWHPAGMLPNQVSFIGWTTNLWEHYKRVSKFHVGLAPLEHTTFNEGKSPLRAVELMALGVPAVYSDVPAYRGVVTHGVNGFLARSPADWRACLQMLVEDAGLRATMGDAARETARAWTIEERVTLWEQAYEGLL